MKGSTSKHWVSIKCSTGATAARPQLPSELLNLVKSLQRQKMAKIFVSRGNQSFVYCTENGFSCVQWSMPQLNYSDHKAEAPPAWECMWNEDMTINLWCYFSSQMETVWLHGWSPSGGTKIILFFSTLAGAAVTISLLRIPPTHIFLLRVTTGKLQLWMWAWPSAHGEHRNCTGHN